LIFVYPIEDGGSAASHIFVIGARLAVIGFFCLSGYLISLSMQENLIRHHGYFSASEYFISRVFRIAPPLLFSLILVAALGGMLFYIGMSATPLSRAAQPTYDPNLLGQLKSMATLGILGDVTGGVNGPLWSLAYEMQLYAIFGLGCAAIRSRIGTIYRVGSLLAALALAWLCFLFEEPAWRWLHILCIAAFTFGWIGFRVLPQANLVASIGIVLICFVGSIALFCSLPGAAVARLNDLDFVLGQTVFAIGFCVLVSMLATRWVAPIRLAQTGAFSYSLYITHFPLMLCLFFIISHVTGFSLAGGWLFGIITVPVAILFASAVSFMIERPKQQRTLLINTLRHVFLRGEAAAELSQPKVCDR